MLSGAGQTPEKIGDAFAKHTGYLEWAASNETVMMFPQVKKVQKINPKGCWDFFGYTGKDYCTNEGV